ncbi:hypothetical protein RIF29_39436 [Crotalaria pallida]|uniref:Uncharacterized protein n=1 Tax=Crotalaria pallida TaxID=3830 RepID=A0AAN9E7I0_CROPI
MVAVGATQVRQTSETVCNTIGLISTSDDTRTGANPSIGVIPNSGANHRATREAVKDLEQVLETVLENAGKGIETGSVGSEAAKDTGPSGMNDVVDPSQEDNDQDGQWTPVVTRSKAQIRS